MSFWKCSNKYARFLNLLQAVPRLYPFGSYYRIEPQPFLLSFHFGNGRSDRNSLAKAMREVPSILQLALGADQVLLLLNLRPGFANVPELYLGSV